MIYLFTGNPGSGKTLSAMEFIETLQREDPGRAIYTNIAGISLPGVLPIDDEGIRTWPTYLPKGSVLVVDEAQRFWRSQRSGDVPAAVIEMETHRHDGIDIVLMTQHPTFLHANIRKLVNVHFHLVAFSKSSALRWEWRECHDDVQENGLRNQGEFKEWHYPARLYQFYDSATMHTKRAKRPLKWMAARITLWTLGTLALVAVIGGGWWMVHRARELKSIGKPQAQSQPAGAPFAASAPRSDQRRAPKYATAAEYVAALMPRVPSQPWSAPIYDGQSPTSHPQVFCMAVTDPDAHDCRCITEQGTRYLVDEGTCRDLATNGPPYDPYKPQERQSRREASDTAPAAPVAAVAIPAGIPGPVVAGVGAQEYEPRTYGTWNPDALSGSK